MKNQLQECANLQNEFKDIIATEDKSFQTHISQSDTDLYKARLQLAEEKAKLNREMGHINLDKEHLQTNETQLYSEICERTSHFQHQKSQLLEERMEIQVSFPCIYIIEN